MKIIELNNDLENQNNFYTKLKLFMIKVNYRAFIKNIFFT